MVPVEMGDISVESLSSLCRLTTVGLFVGLSVEEEGGQIDFSGLKNGPQTNTPVDQNCLVDT